MLFRAGKNTDRFRCSEQVKNQRRHRSSRGQQYTWLTDQGVMNCPGRRNSFVSLWFITYHGVPNAVVGELSILSPSRGGEWPNQTLAVPHRSSLRLNHNH